MLSNTIDLARLLDSNKILPHYEALRAKIAAGGGDRDKLSPTHCPRIPLVCKL